MSSGAQFLELLKQLTANAGAPVATADPASVPAAAPAPALVTTPTLAPVTTPAPTPSGRRQASAATDAPPAADIDARKDARVDDPAQAPPPILVAPVPVPVAAPVTAAAGVPAPKASSPSLPAPLDSNATKIGDAHDDDAEPPVKNVATPNACPQPAPKFAVAHEGQQAAAGSDNDADTVDVPATAPPSAPSAHAAPIAAADDAIQSIIAKPTTTVAARDMATMPVAVAPASPQDASDGAGAQKRDANSGSRDRQNLDVVASRTPAPVQSAAPVFQIASDVRSILQTGTGTVTVASPSLTSPPGGTLSVRDTSEIPQQIVQAMRLQWNNGVGNARITLQPEYLGDVTISIRVERGDVTATLQASQPEVRQWIEGHGAMLRQMLSDRGLQLDEFVVKEDRRSSADDQPHQDQRQNREARERQQSARRRPDSGAIFEVVA